MKQRPSSIVKLVMSAAVLAAMLGLSGPVGNILTAYVEPVPSVWRIVSRLIMLLSGLALASALIQLLLERWTPATGHGRTVRTLAGSALRYLVMLAGLLWGLSILGVDVKALLAAAGVLALIIGFGAESLIADVVTGTFMLFEHQYEVGDIIVVDDFRGTVTQIGIRTTSITDTGGNVKIINNSDIRNLINRSSDSSFAVCDIGIPYQGYLLRAEEKLAQVLPALYKEQSELFQDVPRYLGVQAMDNANDAVILRISAKVAERDIYSAQRMLNRTLLLAFEEAGIPNPVAELKVVEE